jgi:hypothetical protein
MADESFYVHLSSLQAFARELQTQLDATLAPMEALATLSGQQPQYGAFTEAYLLGESQQAAIEEMYGLLSQVKQAISFAESVTNTVATGYQQADQDVASSLGYGGYDGYGGYGGYGDGGYQGGYGDQQGGWQQGGWQQGGYGGQNASGDQGALGYDVANATGDPSTSAPFTVPPQQPPPVPPQNGQPVIAPNQPRFYGGV